MSGTNAAAASDDDDQDDDVDEDAHGFRRLGGQQGDADLGCIVVDG